MRSTKWPASNPRASARATDTAAMRYQLELFFTALGFFTRLPIPAWVPWSIAHLNHSARYFPLVGWIVGGIGAAGFLLAAQLLPATLAVLLSMALTVRLTGAFHEDGFADSCDGLGGGWQKAQALEIMKDSRIGSYGTIGIVLLLLAKAAALVALADVSHTAAALALLIAHPLSRLASTSLIHFLPYVREDENAKSKPLARRLERGELVCAAFGGLAPLLLSSWLPAITALLAVSLTTVWLGRMFLRRLGGYTGDLLGTVQQASELATYAGLLAGSGLAARAAGLPLPY